MPEHNFKVIIIGAGPAGLTAAHALNLAGIDFVVLERRDEIAIDSGASLVLGPPSLRIMEQFGILEDLQKIGGEVQCTKSFDLEGNELGYSSSVRLIRKK